MDFTATEKEIIFLKATTELIDLMVNRDILCLSHSEEGSKARPKTKHHQKFFIIILVDFLSKASEEIAGENTCYLEKLAEICREPKFNVNDSIAPLHNAVESFDGWLKDEIKVSVWLSGVSRNVTIKIMRKELLEICGNATKHNFSRLSIMLSKIRKIFARNREELGEEDALLVLYDIYENFFDGILSYQVSYIVEQLNDIRWGIYEYLKPQFEASIAHDNNHPTQCKYKYPDDIKTKFAKNRYWGLMNEVRSGPPCIERFKTPDVLTRRY